MKSFIMNNASGKSTTLVTLSAEKKIPIVCESDDAVEELKHIARKICVTIPEPVSVDRLETLRETCYPAVLVDDANYVLNALLEKHAGLHMYAYALSPNLYG